MMRIESLQTKPDSLGRHKVTLSDGSVLRLYRQTVEDFGLFTGLELEEETLKEIKAAAKTLGKEIDIEIDGGIDPKTAPLAIQAGANVLVAGSAVFGASDCAAAISALRGNLA